MSKKKWIQVRVDENTLQKVKRLAENEKKTVSSLVLARLFHSGAPINNEQDTIILKKMIPAFIMKNVELELEDAEIARVKELYEGI